jgi:TP901 family phage tail tape measure protein
MSDLLLRARLTLDPQQWKSGLASAGGNLKSFTSLARREFGALHSFMGSTAGKVAGLAGGVSVASELLRSAKMDQSLTRIGISANLSLAQVGTLRSELLKLGKQSGESTADLQEASAALFAQGMGYDSVRNSLAAINRTMPLTTATAGTLADALGVASTAFNFDLTKPGEAQRLLDKMATAGNQASAELQDLAPLVARVGVNARAGGFGYEQMLGFIEGLSKIESNPERLGTLADSTLRLFTNAQYLKNAQKGTGVKFFDTDGSRRDPLKVLEEIKRRMDQMKTDAQREAFLSRAFGQADLDTIKGLRTLLSGDMLAQVNKFTSNIANGAGTIDASFTRATNNAVSQTGRLRNSLVDAADAFSTRLNSGITKGIRYLLDSKKDGGLGLSGGEVAGGAAALTLAAYGGGRLLKGAAGRLLGGTAGLASGVAMGSVLEKAGAATPVFIVGAAPGLMGGIGGGVGLPGAAGGAAGGAATAARLGGLRLLGARAALAGGSSVFGAGGLMTAGTGGVATTLGGVGIAALGGWGIGTLANMGINSNKYTRNAFQFLAAPGLRNASYMMAALGNSEARATVADEYRQGRGMTRLEMATAGGVGPFNWLAQTLMRVGRETKQRRELEKLAVDVSVTDKRVYATVQQAPGGGSGVVATVRNRAAPATGRMMPGSGQ